MHVNPYTSSCNGLKVTMDSRNRRSPDFSPNPPNRELTCRDRSSLVRLSHDLLSRCGGDDRELRGKYENVLTAGGESIGIIGVWRRGSPG